MEKFNFLVCTTVVIYLFLRRILNMMRIASDLWVFVATCMFFGCDLSHFVASNIFCNHRSITTSSVIISIIWCASPNCLIFSMIQNPISITIQMQSTTNRISTIMYWYLCKCVETLHFRKENKMTIFFY